MPNTIHNFLFDPHHAMYYFPSFHSIKYHFTKTRSYTSVHLFSCPQEVNTILQKNEDKAPGFSPCVGKQPFPVSVFFHFSLKLQPSILSLSFYPSHSSPKRSQWAYEKGPESNSSCGRSPVCSHHTSSRGVPGTSSFV